MKRDAEEYSENNSENRGEKKMKSTAPEFRFVIERKQQGLLIGKGGSKIKNVRDETGVVASILKVDNTDAPERILVLQGEVEQCATAFKMFGDIMVESQTNSEMKVNDPNVVVAKVLCDKNQIGSVIGKGGASIRQTQADTGARVQCSNDVLPGSTEKTVNVTGSPEIVRDALKIVLTQLHKFPLRAGSISTKFTPGLVHPQMYNPYGTHLPPDPYGHPRPHGYGYPPEPYAHHQPHNQRGHPHASISRPYPHPVPHVGPTISQKIAIPTTCAGGVIGKGGGKIREIQAQSGCAIRIADADPSAPDERIVTVDGSNEGIQIAIQLIRVAVEAAASQAQAH
mmetsp:Transcript_32137/g.62863  ORF Transcript_32137/g.62863 Transcript_32137/m.62863 type:complete len:340 (+) Transcript_32137:89-1108(+)